MGNSVRPWHQVRTALLRLLWVGPTTGGGSPLGYLVVFINLVVSPLRSSSPNLLLLVLRTYWMCVKPRLELESRPGSVQPSASSPKSPSQDDRLGTVIPLSNPGGKFSDLYCMAVDGTQPY
ncbi:hypothetical protein EDB89DRAFT_1910441 [Lactarius sanguifluus]|nr:hypothetical protein EDB89DRAFT_1910441 [Lactarius sanguifluus]